MRKIQFIFLLFLSCNCQGQKIIHYKDSINKLSYQISETWIPFNDASIESVEKRKLKKINKNVKIRCIGVFRNSTVIDNEDLFIPLIVEIWEMQKRIDLLNYVEDTVQINRIVFNDLKHNHLMYTTKYLGAHREKVSAVNLNFFFINKGYYYVLKCRSRDDYFENYKPEFFKIAESIKFDD